MIFPIVRIKEVMRDDGPTIYLTGFSAWKDISQFRGEKYKERGTIVTCKKK
jgi:hypothetical protein